MSSVTILLMLLVTIGIAYGIRFVDVIVITSNISAMQQIADEEEMPYYGLPLGAVHYASDGTQAEVYAADDRTILLANYRHRPIHPGCKYVIVE